MKASATQLPKMATQIIPVVEVRLKSAIVSPPTGPDSEINLNKWIGGVEIVPRNYPSYVRFPLVFVDSY